MSVCRQSFCMIFSFYKGERTTFFCCPLLDFGQEVKKKVPKNEVTLTQASEYKHCSLTGCLLCASKPGKLIAKACALAQNYLLVEPSGGVRAFARFFVRLSASAVTFLMLTEPQRPQQLFSVPPSAVRLFFRGPTKFSLLSSQNFPGAKYECGNICRPVEAPPAPIQVALSSNRGAHHRTR